MDQIVIGKIMLKCNFFSKILKMLLAFVELHATQKLVSELSKREEKKNRKILYRKLSGTCLPVNDMNVIKSL